MELDRRTFIAALAAAQFAPYARASQRSTVQWGGVSFAGDLDTARRQMPVVCDALLNDQSLLHAFQQRTADAVRSAGAHHPELDFRVDEQVRQTDDAYSLCLVIAGESVNVVDVEDVTEASFELQALVLIGNVSKDPSRQRVVASHPLRVRHRTVFTDGRKPGPEDARRYFRSMLVGDRHDGCADLVAEWQERLQRARISERDVWISIAPVRFAPEALQEARLADDAAASLSARATALIESNLSRTAGIPLVPAGSSGALEAMTLSFADRGIVAFRTPDPSHMLELTVFGLRSFASEQELSREKRITLAFGGGFQLDYSRIDADRRKSGEFSVRLKSVQSRSFIASSRDSRRISNAAAYGSLVLGFAEQLSTNIVPANPKWLDSVRADSEPQSVAQIVRHLKRLPSRSA